MLQKTLLIFSIFSAAALALASDVQPIQSGERTIVQLASNDPALSTFVTALKAANLTAKLSGAGDGDRQTDGPFTVFAPTNEAFTKLPAATLAHLLEPANIRELQSVLEYHVLSSVVYIKDIKAGSFERTLQGRSFERTLQGNYLTFSTYDIPETNETYVRINDGAALVEFADLKASNGVVHVIDDVLVPARDSDINQIIGSKPELSTFQFALESAFPRHSLLQGDGPLNRFGDRPGFTVFAPTNDAFAKLPAGLLDHLLDIDNLAELRSFLEYHVLGGVTLSAGCSNGDTRPGTFGGVCGNFDLDVLSFVDTLEGQYINVDARVVNGSGTVVLTPTADVTVLQPNAKFSTIVEKNLGATNGIVHVIDRVLTPPAPTRTIFKALDNGFHATFVAALKAGALEQTLNDPATGPYTVLVPTDEAFAKLPAGTLDHLLDPKNILELQKILKFHIIPGKALRVGCTTIGITCGPDDLEGDAIKFGYQPATAFWETLAGQSVIVFEGTYATGNATTYVGDSTNIAGVIQPFRNSLGDGINAGNIAASNGIWHIIDKVLIPKLAPPAPTPASNMTICDVVAANPNLSTLNTALKAAQFNYLCETSAPQYPNTLFAPSNAAFDRLPKATLAHLLDPANVGELATLLEYHVAPGLLPNPVAYYSKDLTNGEKIPTLHVRKLPAEGNRDKVTVTIDDKAILINDAFVTTADIGAYNGIIHIIDTVLTLPTQPAKTVTDVVAATPEFATLVTPVYV